MEETMRLVVITACALACVQPALARDPSNPFASVFAPAQPAPVQERVRYAAAPAGASSLDAAIARHAALNGVPESLVRRVIVRESRYNARVVSRGNWGLMQIKPATARSMGYAGSPAGLLDAETNLTYAVRYLAGAYRVAGGNADRAVSYYARGYYYAAKRAGMRQSVFAGAAPAGPAQAQTPRERAMAQAGTDLMNARRDAAF
jgi:soluble lytic murein transglycosylase-like protein